MSNPHSHHGPVGEPADRTLLMSALGWIGVMLVFAFIVVVAYLPNRPPSPDAAAAAERYEIRREVDREQRRLIERYQWEDANEGIVRLPIERAMELTVEERRRTNSARLASD